MDALAEYRLQQMQAGKSSGLKPFTQMSPRELNKAARTAKQALEKSRKARARRKRARPPLTLDEKIQAAERDVQVVLALMAEEIAYRMKRLAIAKRRLASLKAIRTQQERGTYVAPANRPRRPRSNATRRIETD
jgi:hypothetical protein